MLFRSVVGDLVPLKIGDQVNEGSLYLGLRLRDVLIIIPQVGG